MQCKARRHNDGSYWCAECGIGWDADDGDTETSCAKLRKESKYRGVEEDRNPNREIA